MSETLTIDRDAVYERVAETLSESRYPVITGACVEAITNVVLDELRRQYLRSRS